MANKKEIKKTAIEIVDELCNRSGFDDWWYNIDDETQEEIYAKIEEILDKRLEAKNK